MTDPLYTWQEVPGWFDFGDIYLDMVSAAPAVGAHFVEVGVMFGRSTLFMAERIKMSKKEIRFDAVDPLTIDAAGAVMCLNHAKCSRTTNPILAKNILDVALHGGQGEATRHILANSGLERHINLIASRGQEQAPRYSDHSLDFVFLDAEHTYRDTCELLLTYRHKLKLGGILAGHDYMTGAFPDVERAVRDILGSEVTRQKSSFLWRNSNAR